VGPAGAYYRSRVLSLSGARGHLDAGLKCLVQTGLDLKSPFNSNGFRSRRKPDWPVYWQPWWPGLLLLGFGWVRISVVKPWAAAVRAVGRWAARVATC
jgi:hypothetical protein